MEDWKACDGFFKNVQDKLQEESQTDPPFLDQEELSGYLKTALDKLKEVNEEELPSLEDRVSESLDTTIQFETGLAETIIFYHKKWSRRFRSKAYQLNVVGLLPEEMFSGSIVEGAFLARNDQVITKGLMAECEGFTV